MDKSEDYFKAQQNNLVAVNGYVEKMYSGHTCDQYNAVDTSKKRDLQGLNLDLRQYLKISIYLRYHDASHDLCWEL